MSPLLSMFSFRKGWKEKHGHLPEPNKNEMRYYLETSARINRDLPKHIQVKRAIDMAADDYSPTSPEGL